MQIKALTRFATRRRSQLRLSLTSGKETRVAFLIGLLAVLIAVIVFGVFWLILGNHDQSGSRSRPHGGGAQS